MSRELKTKKEMKFILKCVSGGEAIRYAFYFVPLPLVEGGVRSENESCTLFYNVLADRIRSFFFRKIAVGHGGGHLTRLIPFADQKPDPENDQANRHQGKHA